MLLLCGPQLPQAFYGVGQGQFIAQAHQLVHAGSKLGCRSLANLTRSMSRASARCKGAQARLGNAGWALLGAFECGNQWLHTA